ncbi:MAG: DUF3365 domain-containing protein [Desulfobacteraceae bacterium]|nr:MAG: DUF3365 domain-containing protein [Desulfobacteraceae bacterium]
MDAERKNSQSGKFSFHANQLFYYSSVLAVIWTTIISLSLAWNIYQIKQTSKILATEEARSHFNKDQAFRFWATNHGGVYVPIDNRTQPSLYLNNVPERDITTPSGKKLTLMNPAYMLRQMMDEFKELYGVQGRITSLKPFRPQNAPDEWERSALLSFEKGIKEVFEFVDIENEPHLRLIRPMMVKKGCLKCHGYQGYKVGDVRGGVGISISMSPYLTQARSEIRKLSLSHLFIWSIGSIGIYFSFKRLRYNLEERRRVEKERRTLESQLQQAQKLEAIGILASGIAHDFNNILFPLISYAEMIKEDLPTEHPLQQDVDSILTCAIRARDLVRQILTFSRQEESVLGPIKPQPIVKEAIKLLRSAIPKTIDIIQNIDPNCGLINTDPTKFYQVIMNLATNAYHAMEETGGILTVKLEQTDTKQGHAKHGDMLSGPYAHLTVSDTGGGIEEEIIGRVFDPYFTTKDKSKGTGLGLSVVYGIVKECSGEIDLHSEPGKGTDIHVYFPIIERPAEERRKAPAIIPGGTERILLVDDEEEIANALQRMLTRLGYQVTSRTRSIDALETFKANPEGFDLIITDLTMADMTGTQLARMIKMIRSDIPIIMTTGSGDPLSDERWRTSGIQDLVMKPLIKKELAEIIRKVLDKCKEG